MFDYIKGTVVYIEENMLVIENSGIGYRVLTSAYAAGRISLHEQVTIYTYLHIREDDISLFGFLSREEITVFQMLISVSGIGPKGALSILSVLTVEELRIAVLSDDHKAICKANGIGAKTAQRLIIELRDKFRLEDVFSDISAVDELPEAGGSDTISETAMALAVLGYSNVEALRAIKKVQDYETMSAEELLKAALKKIM